MDQDQGKCGASISSVRTFERQEPSECVPASQSLSSLRGQDPGLDGAAPTLRSLAFPSPELATGSSSLPCIREDQVLDYVNGKCSESQLLPIDVHLNTCRSCRDLLHYWLDGLRPTENSQVAHRATDISTFVHGDVVNDRYKIRRFIGRGGMGEVYEVDDQLMGSRLALKTLVCTTSDKPQAVRRLKEEVRNALRVGHPHVCRINELQEHHFSNAQDPGLPFFTMELIEGERLAQRVRRKLMPVRDVQCVARQLLSGLEAAHARGILHLDFKSDNVMLRTGTSAPNAIIMDFGLSRALDAHSPEQTSERLEMAGTLPYMPVEQLECRSNLEPSADIYAFGVVLYEMLTGQLPFRAANLSAMLLKQLRHRPQRPSSHQPGLSSRLDQFVLRCLHPDSSKRFDSAGSALAALPSVRQCRAGRFGGHVVRRAALLVFGLSTIATVGLVYRAQQRPATEPPQPLDNRRASPSPVVEHGRQLQPASPSKRQPLHLRPATQSAPILQPVAPVQKPSPSIAEQRSPKRVVQAAKSSASTNRQEAGSETSRKQGQLKGKVRARGFSRKLRTSKKH